MAIFLLVLLSLLMAFQLSVAVISKDKKQIFSPAIFLSIYLTYYIVLPFLKGGGNASEKAQILLIAGALIFYIVFQIAFQYLPGKYSFPKVNSLLTTDNSFIIAIVLFMIAFVGNGIFNGFGVSILSSNSREDIIFDEGDSFGHIEMYVTYLISLFTFACPLIYISKKRITPLLLVMMVISMAIYIIGGFRYRILVFFVVFAVVYYLYPTARRINLFIVLPLVIALYLLMGVIETTRMYGQGLDAAALKELTQSGEIREAREDVLVYEFSAECMDRYKVDDFILFEPLVNAVCSPLPRSIFPWKPKGTYMREANMKIYGTVAHGNAFLNITEAYISFGWLGIILYALFMGWLSRVFWSNYLSNSSSIGSIVLLALYNGTLYQVIARGYMAFALTTFLYYIVIPFILVLIYNFIMRLVKQ
ncbi:MAG: hypothetical protein MJZ09_05265 [Bacteroidales bacterium]|nr:hypothetical protein [Bacteroidales bacterium]